MSAAASRLSLRLLRAWLQTGARSSLPTRLADGRRPGVATRCVTCRHYSDEAAPAPPLLAKLKGDLKSAMRAKDAPRLAVLRSVMAATLNASKTGSPIATDAALVALLRKTANLQREAAAEFREAGREDLAEKEDAQIAVLEEYVSRSGVEILSQEDLRRAVVQVRRGLDDTSYKWGDANDSRFVKRNVGKIMQQIMLPGGPLQGKEFDKKELALVVEKEVASMIPS